MRHPREERLEIALQDAGRFAEVEKGALEAWLARLVGALAPDAGSVGVRFLGDRGMRRLNQRFRGRDATTDVLSFPGQQEGHLGDIALSVPAARRQATRCGHATQREIRLLLLHGVLHCLGYDHETDDGTMARRERLLRRRWIDDGE